VTDVKIPFSKRLARRMGALWAWLHLFHFIPGDKVTGILRPISFDTDGALTAILTGSSLGYQEGASLKPQVELTLPLDLTGYTGPLVIEDILQAVPGVTVDDGGNAQNMIVNMAYMAAAAAPAYPQFSPDNLQFLVTGSSDPLARFSPELKERLGRYMEFYSLGAPDRWALQFPYNTPEKSGTMTIATEPLVLSDSLIRALKSDPSFARKFRNGSIYIGTEPLFGATKSYGGIPRVEIINASTSLRPQVAIEAYGTPTVLPMNAGEASHVCQLMLAKGWSSEIDKTPAPPFPSPLTTTGDKIDMESLHHLDESITLYLRYNQLMQKINGIGGFGCPISFGAEGGLIIGYGGQSIACFSSTPGRGAGESALLNEFAIPDRVTPELYDVGAGDSVAATVALFNSVDPNAFIVPLLKGNEVSNRQLLLLASTIFVSVFGRVIGNFQVRTQHTYLENLDPAKFPDLLRAVAEESLKLARVMFKRLPNPTIGEISRWNIHVVVWHAERVAYPNGIS